MNLPVSTPVARALTPGQHAMWFTEQARAANGAYQMAVRIWFDAGLDDEALRSACAAVVRRHPALRSVVRLDDGVPHLVELDEGPVLETQPMARERIQAQIASGSIDGALARMVLYRDGADQCLLQVTAHHLCFDGMSKDILVRDLAAAYAAKQASQRGTSAQRSAAERAELAERAASTAVTGGAWPEPVPPPRSVAEPVSESAELASARAYWAAHWSPPAVPVLPGLRTAATGTAVAGPGAEVEFTIGPELIGRLRGSAAAIGVTRFELIVAAIHAVLGRYGNAGLPVAVGLSTRSDRDAERIGSFVNELPLPIAAEPGPEVTFADYARSVRDRLRELYRFRTVAFGQAVKGLRPAVALTPVSIGYRRRAEEPTFPGVRSRVEWMVFNGVARNTLHIQMVDSGVDVAVSLQYDPTAIAADAVARIGAHLRTALAGAVAEPHRPLRRLSILAAEEVAHLRRWNATDRDYPAAATVPALFAEQVLKAPEAVAATDGRRTLTYGELDRLSAGLAATLRGRGIGRGAIVGVGLPRSVPALVVLLAVMRSGGAYVPVDPAYPARRRALLLDDAAPALLVTTTALAGAHPGPVLALDDLSDIEALAGIDAHGHPAAPAAGDPAYVMYTSGSTGRPKGVVVPHGALANLLLGMRDLLGSGPEDRWLGLTSLSFDISGLELYLPLVTGARVVVAADQGWLGGVGRPERLHSALDGPALDALIAAQGVTHVQATPSGWRVLLEAAFGDSEGASQRGTSEERTERGAESSKPSRRDVVALCGGEALPAGLAARLRERVRSLTNVYGPTETTIWSTAGDVADGSGEVGIGGPIANTQVHVLDEQLRPVPIGMAGEICIGGAGLAHGYLRQPGQTADRFVPDPYGRPGGRLYRTGDLGHWTADGRLVIRGRVDTQVKIRGHRVELGEIEARLSAHPGVAEAAVVLREDGEQGGWLAGYVVPVPGVVADPVTLREHLSRDLPAVMVPTAWMVLDTFPRTPNGKLDRRALPAPTRPGPAPTGPAPAGASGDGEDTVVAQLRAIWQEVLQVDVIGPHDDLFDLGGHSLIITRINGRVRQQFGVELPLDVYFDTPTVAEVADVLRDSLDATTLDFGGSR